MDYEQLKKDALLDAEGAVEQLRDLRGGLIRREILDTFEEIIDRTVGECEKEAKGIIDHFGG